MAKEVSARVCVQLLNAMEARGIPAAELLRGLPVSSEDLRRPRSRVSWSTCAALLECVAERLGGPEALEEFGLEHAARPVFGWYPAVARAAISPRDLYWLGKFYGNSVFRNVPCRFEVLPGDRVRQTLTIPEQDVDSPAFFHLMRGVLRSTPRFLGLPESRVEMDLAPRWASYSITPPKSLSLPARLLRRLRFSSSALREVVDELTLQHEELVLTCQQLIAANAELREQVEGRQRAESELQGAQRLEAVGRLASGLAHEFNNALTTVMVCTEIALDHIDDPNAARDDLARIRSAAERAAGITAKLLTFSRSEPVRPAVLDLNESVSHFEDVLGRLIGDTIGVTTELGGDLDKVKVDPTQIDQVILNLVFNARDAMADGGKITIATSNARVDGDGPDDPPRLEPGRYVRLSVRDLGCGMDEATRAQMFEPFFTTKPVGEGTGLGLSIVYGIATQNGGTVSVSTKVGGGTTVHVYLPATDEVPETAELSARDVSRPRHPATVLLAEDDPELRNAICRILRGAGHAVLEASDGDAASRIAAERSGRIDVLVTDVRMPHVSGWELGRALRSRDPALRVLYISGYPEDGTSRQLARGDAFLRKPFSVECLRTELRSLLDSSSVD
jgi:signal transduction histidine kinase/CheY-like chemotaxis protein